MDYPPLKKGQRWRLVPKPGKTGTGFDFTLGKQKLTGHWSLLDCTSLVGHTTAYNDWWSDSPFANYTMILLCAEAHK